MVINEALIRSTLQFNDLHGVYELPISEMHEYIRQMGYEGDYNAVTLNKGKLCPHWKFLFHTLNHCISPKSTSWDQIPSNVATAAICLITNRQYNFSRMIFDGMIRQIGAKKQFIMYPRFLQLFLAD